MSETLMTDDDPGVLTVLEILRERGTGRGVPRNELEDLARSEGIGEGMLERILAHLYDTGRAYEPNLRYVKYID
ncbi:MAG: mediator of RNA polymerase II transcription subunit 1 [archaeon]|nr:mediator of RNA polymerase II transcription subunit 1 [archaeon]